MQNKGFTLIELLLYVSIASTVLLASTVFFHMLLESRVKNQTISEVEQQGLLVMQRIAHAVRNAESVTSPTIGTNGASLTLDVVDVSDDPTVFDLAGGVAQVTEGGAAAAALTNSRVVVSDLLFENLSYADTPGVVRVSFTLTHMNPEGRQEYSYTKDFITSISLRAN